MRTIRQRFIREIERFERCCDGPARTEQGLSQFHAFESRGIRPEAPDPYFSRLVDGKRWWEWTVNEYAGQHLTYEWPGWLQLSEDFAGDRSGLQQIADRVGVAIPREIDSARQTAAP